MLNFGKNFCFFGLQKQKQENFHAYSIICLHLHFYKEIRNEHHYSWRRRSRNASGGGLGAQQPQHHHRGPTRGTAKDDGIA